MQTRSPNPVPAGTLPSSPNVGQTRNGRCVRCRLRRWGLVRHPMSVRPAPLPLTSSGWYLLGRCRRLRCFCHCWRRWWRRGSVFQCFTFRIGVRMFEDATSILCSVLVDDGIVFVVLMIVDGGGVFGERAPFSLSQSCAVDCSNALMWESTSDNARRACSWRILRFSSSRVLVLLWSSRIWICSSMKSA